MKRLLKWAGALALACSTCANAAVVTGGQTSVALDTALLATVGLNLTGVTGPVINPGDLPGSVAFPINPRDAEAPALPTTFAFTPGTLAPFTGAIQHSGGVIFNDSLTVGNFTITQDNGVFVVLDQITFPGVPLFTLGNIGNLVVTDLVLQASADLLVSSALASVLGNSELTGVDVGDALVRATAVPEPGGLALILVAVLGLFATARGRRDGKPSALGLH